MLIRSLPPTLFLLASACLTGGVAQAQRTGRPAADVISRLTQPRAVSITGNSVDTGTGNFSLEASVLQVQGGRALDFTVMHDSITTPAAIIGQPLLVGVGWTHAYAARLQGRPGGPVTVHWDDHRSNRFGYSNGSYPPLDEANRYDQLQEVNGINRCASCAWRVTREDGTVLAFDENGVLKIIGNKIGQVLQVEKTLGRLDRVLEPISNRELRFTYGAANRIQYVSDPAERRAYFEYDSLGRLTAIHNPSTISELLVQPAVILPIPDNGVFEQFINISGRPEKAGIVLLPGTRFSHPRPSDVRVTLTSPSGKEVDITDLAEHPTATVFNYGEVFVNAFQGDVANGRWRLRIFDQAPGVTGESFGFTVQVSEPTYPTFFRYSDAGQVAEALDADGNRLFANAYDSLGRVTAQDDGRAETPLALFGYQETAQGIVTTYTDRLGFAYRYEHDNNYRLLRYVDPLEGETRYEYAFNGDRTAIVDALGRRTSFQYDGGGNVTQVTDAAGNVTRMTFVGKNLSTFTDAEGAVTSFTMNNGNITNVRDAEGNQDRRNYNNGQLTNVLLDDGAGMGLSYSMGQVTSGQMLHGPYAGGASYDEIGLPGEIEDAEGNKIQLEYDGRGNVIRRTDPLGGVEIMEYDARNRLVRSVDRNGNVTRTQYDGNSNIVARTNALGHTTQFVYDHGDRLVELIDALGNSSTRNYDAVGRLISETNAVGETTMRRYDKAGNLLAIVDPRGATVLEVAYDELDLAIATTDAAGNVSQTRYDKVQRPIELIDPLGRSQRLTYDKIGRLVRVDDPSGRTTSQRFFSDDVVRGMTDGSGAENTFGYDQQNRVRQFTPSTGSVAQIQWTYDDRGLPTQEALPGGATKSYQYDNAGRLTQISYTGEGSRPTKQYAYDSNGNLTTVRSGGPVQLRRTFDGLNRVTSFTDPHGDTLRYAYDGNGRLVRLTYPDGKAVNYEYDAAGRLTAVVDWAQRRTTFGYSANSLLTDITFPNGTTRQMTFDDAGRLVRRRDLTSGGIPIVDYRYAYDPVGMLTEEYGGASMQPAVYQPAAMSFTYRNDGRFQTINGAPANYDARGNLTSLPNGTLAYDADGNLLNGPGGSYEYDAEDRLIAWTKSGGRTRFTVNPQAQLDQILVERAPNGSTTRYVYGGGLLYEESGGGIRVFHYDQRGSAVAFTGTNGTMIGTASYGPFGEVIDQTGQAQSIFLFCGLYGVVSDGSGLNYMRFRWYSPDLKRFLSPDSHYGDILDPSSLNRYAYAGNNPVNFIDPGGEFLNVLIGAAVGAVVNVVATAVVAAVTGQPLTAGDLIGAAVGGAITGGLIGACGPACAGAGAFIASSIGASVVGGAIGNATGQAVDIATGAKDGFDWKSFGTEVAASAVFGALPFGKGAKGAATALSRGAGEGAEAALKRGARSSTSKLLRGGVSAPKGFGSIKPTVPKLGRPTSVPKIPSKLKHLEPTPRELAEDIGIDLSVGIGQGLFVNAVKAQSSAGAPGTASAASRDTLTVRQEGLREVNEGRRSYYGEYSAWNFYQAVHTLAGRPLPNNPNPALPQF